MAVIIQNFSEAFGLTYGKGTQKYELRINKFHKCLFEHEFEDGLAVCLRKAADALEKEERNERATGVPDTGAKEQTAESKDSQG